MRLTLRTLLAYLDDTLPPSEAKSIGVKLAESEPAQEIVERIKNVIRRRRLTVPPAASRMDANTIAEYLDNEITPEGAEVKPPKRAAQAAPAEKAHAVDREVDETLRMGLPSVFGKDNAHRVIIF